MLAILISIFRKNDWIETHNLQIYENLQSEMKQQSFNKKINKQTSLMIQISSHFRMLINRFEYVIGIKAILVFVVVKTDINWGREIEMERVKDVERKRERGRERSKQKWFGTAIELWNPNKITGC